MPSRCAPCAAGRDGSPSTLSGSLAQNPTAVREVPGAQVHTHARFLLCVFSRREEGPPAGSPSPSAARFNRGRSPGEGGARGTTFGAPAACRTHDLLPGRRPGRQRSGRPPRRRREPRLLQREHAARPATGVHAFLLSQGFITSLTFKLRFHFASLRNGKGQETRKLPPRAETSVLKPFWLLVVSLCENLKSISRGNQTGVCLPINLPFFGSPKSKSI